MPERPGKSTRPLNVPSVLKPTFTVPPETAASPPLAVAVFMARLEVPDAVITALMLMSRAAVSVSRLALQLTVSLTLMSPDPATVEPWLERMVTPLEPSAVESVEPDMSPEGVPPVTVPVLSDAIVKSFGSISQLPV